MTATPHPSAELRAAAEKLRALAVAAPAGPWRLGDIGEVGWTVECGDGPWFETADSDTGRALGAYIAAMQPAVGLALAHLIDLEETYLVGMPDNERLAHVRAALAVARQVLGTVQP